MTLPNTICMLPWISLEASPQGTAKPCCLYDDEILDDNGNKYLLAEHGLQEIYKSKSTLNYARVPIRQKTQKNSLPIQG